MAVSRFATFLESFDRDPKTRGTQWEHVCKWFLETDPVYRAQLKKDDLSTDRYKRLTALNFVWDTLAAQWEEGFAHLTAYVEAEGHTRVPYSYRTAEGYRLGQWVSIQRTRKDDLSADRHRRLTELNLVWDPFATQWEEGFAHLTAYVEAEGHTRVPSSYCTADGYRLGQWVSGQRSTKDTMSADRRQRLEAVKGWVWAARSSTHGRKNR